MSHNVEINKLVKKKMAYHFDYARILIVDDDEKYLASLRRILKGHFEIVTTRDPVQALKLVEFSGPFAVVISDYRMPVMNGIELFSRIVSIDKNVQRIMLTGYAELQMAIDAINHGKITSFLTKPTPAASIRAVVIDALQAYNQLCSRTFQPIPGPAQQPDIFPEAKSIPKLFASLTVKEKEILFLLAKGLSNEEISIKLNITVGTVKSHINNLFGKMGVNRRSKVIAKGIELGLLRI